MQKGINIIEENHPRGENKLEPDVFCTVNYVNTEYRNVSTPSQEILPPLSDTQTDLTGASQAVSENSDEDNEFAKHFKNRDDNFFYKFTTQFRKIKDQSYKEISIGDLGFTSLVVPDWDNIRQPPKPDLLMLLYRMLKNYEKTNVQICIGDTIFNCHMIVLQSYSNFFMNLGNEQLVILPSDQVTPQAFMMIYNWMLSSNPTVQRKGILELFTAAQYLQISSLIRQCWVCLDDGGRFQEEAAFVLYLEARARGHTQVKDMMITRICKFFLTVVSSKEFVEMTEDELCKLLSTNSIGVNSETEVLLAAVRWFNHDWEERKKYIYNVVSCVRFGLMTPWQLVELRRNVHAPEVARVVQQPEVQKMIDDGLSYVTTKYWYENCHQNLASEMKRLNLIEPNQRQWMRDKIIIDSSDCPNQQYTSYKSFLEYLEMIREMSEPHWQTLECIEESPNAVQLSKPSKIDNINSMNQIVSKTE